MVKVAPPARSRPLALGHPRFGRPRPGPRRRIGRVLGPVGSPGTEPRVRAGAALAAWAGLIAVAHVWGRHLLDTGHRIELGLRRGAPPIVGEIDWRISPRILPAVALAVAGVAFGPRLAKTLTWRRLLLVTFLTAAAWAVALAFLDPHGITQPMLWRGEYLHDVPAITSPLDFLDGLTGRLLDYHIHVQAHPPGMVLLLWLLDQVGLGGAGWAATLVITGGALAVPATLIAARALGNEPAARVAAPFLVLAPAALWVASTADALYMGVVATGLALLALAGQAAASPALSGRRVSSLRFWRSSATPIACEERQFCPDGPGSALSRPGLGLASHRRPTGPVPGLASRPRSDVLAAGAGIVLGAALFMSYGAALAAIPAAAIALHQRRVRPLVIAGAASTLWFMAFAAAGFWWVDGLNETRRLYALGVAARRPYSYFVVANLAAFALVLGPATAVALTRARRLPFALFIAGAAAAVLVADLTGLSKAEVERIWLFLAPGLLLSTAALAGRHAHRWLALQAAATIMLTMAVRTPW